MKVLICTPHKMTNQYVELLADAYQHSGVEVVFGAENFLYTNFKPDFVHIQWPEAIYKWRISLPKIKESIILISNRLLWYREQNIPIVYTLHNNLPHDAVSDYDKKIFKTIAEYADVVVHHGKESIIVFKNMYHENVTTRHIIVPHGPYPYFPADGQDTKLKYNIPMNKFVFINFGIQRTYKGADFTKAVFKSLNNRNTYLLTIGKFHQASEFGSELQKISNYLEKKFKLNAHRLDSLLPNKSAKTIYKEINNEELPKILSAADVMFLGHQKGLNSGILALAASYGKPVVYPRIGNFEEQLLDYSWQESYTVGSIRSATEALKKMFDRIKTNNPGYINMDNTKWIENARWSKHIEKILCSIKNLK